MKSHETIALAMLGLACECTRSPGCEDEAAEMLTYSASRMTLAWVLDAPDLTTCDAAFGKHLDDLVLRGRRLIAAVEAEDESESGLGKS